MKQDEKIMKTASVFIGCALEGRVCDIIEQLEDYKKEYGGDCRIEEEYGYGDSADTYLYYNREETDAEQTKRIAATKRQKEKRKADKVAKSEQDRKDYERLKKKFE